MDTMKDSGEAERIILPFPPSTLLPSSSATPGFSSPAERKRKKFIFPFSHYVPLSMEPLEGLFHGWANVSGKYQICFLKVWTESGEKAIL